MFAYAASYFGDPDAQYQLERLYLDGSPSDPRQASRWFQLALLNLTALSLKSAIC
jgi:uncharacterized protein